MARLLLVALVLVGVTLVPAGCGGKAGGAKEVAGQLLEALTNRDTGAAAELFAYQTLARQQNEDWDSLPAGQRSLIIEKLRGDKAVELMQWAALFSSTEYRLGDVQVTDGTATVSLVPPEGPGIPCHLVREDDAWKVQFVGSPQAVISPVPGR